MGIDAKILVRNKRAPLDERQIRALAGRMCSVIGSEHFFIIKSASDHSSPRHALSLVETKAELEAAYGVEAEISHVEPDRQVYLQDGPWIVGEPDEQLIQAHLWSRWYGVGYERGTWPVIRATIEFLEANLDGCEVWYGGDSSGVLAQRYDAAARELLNRHYLLHGHEPYRSGFSVLGPGAAQVCDFCAGRPMNNVGRGQDRAFWECDGCGEKRIVHSDGRAEVLKDREDFLGQP